MRILLVEDNTDLATSIAEFLSINDCICDFAFNGIAGLDLATANEYDLYVFDIAMPRLSGLDLCDTLRNKFHDQTPVLFLTARDSLDDKLAGYEVGGDDYLVKPFELKELLVRLQAIYKRVYGHRQPILELRALKVDLASKQVFKNDETVVLSPNNFKLLVTLMQRAPGLVSREELEHILWGDEPPDSDSLRSHIYKLRRIIDTPGSHSYIQTVKGQGVRIS